MRVVSCNLLIAQAQVAKNGMCMLHTQSRLRLSRSEPLPPGVPPDAVPISLDHFECSPSEIMCFQAADPTCLIYPENPTILDAEPKKCPDYQFCRSADEGCPPPVIYCGEAEKKCVDQPAPTCQFKCFPHEYCVPKEAPCVPRIPIALPQQTEEEFDVKAAQTTNATSGTEPAPESAVPGTEYDVAIARPAPQGNPDPFDQAVGDIAEGLEHPVPPEGMLADVVSGNLTEALDEMAAAVEEAANETTTEAPINVSDAAVAPLLPEETTTTTVEPVADTGFDGLATIQLAQTKSTARTPRPSKIQRRRWMDSPVRQVLDMLARDKRRDPSFFKHEELSPTHFEDMISVKSSWFR
mmetsp:Transcript_27204/g.65498  ORF Transcript_27204/g.65498 Transcript_27204/m.65498 type:complete len:353 (+) Transcript_27204:86-1144(+)